MKLFFIFVVSYRYSLMIVVLHGVFNVCNQTLSHYKGTAPTAEFTYWPRYLRCSLSRTEELLERGRAAWAKVGS